MSDARSLLRQQREARRITHAHASYSDAGKLLCTACREPVKTEALWDSHIQSESHRKRIALLEQQQQPQKETPAAAAATTTAKRKHQDDEDEDMRDGENPDDAENDDDSARAQARSRRKRSRPDLSDSDSLKDMSHTPPPPPPSMTRRSSGTPSQGVELQIPSRPATPRGTSSSSTTNGGSTHSTALPSRQASTLIPGPPLKPIASAAAGKQQDRQQAAAPAAQAVDEDEWAAFEADMAATEYAAEATISAPAMTNEEAEAAERAKAEAADDGGDPRKRTTQREADLQGEKEDAQRALEEEFDEMQSLEAKVTKLKQQRDALKQRAASHGGHEGGKPQQRPVLAAEKENEAVVEEDEDEDESDDEDEDDGWDGFRFRTGVAGRS